MKIEPRLPQLPSLSELLEHPRVKGLVARVNRSILAKRAGGFLEEVRSTLVERASRAEVPSLTHLAERLARRLFGEPAAAGPVINATGLVLGADGLVAPLAEPALHAMVQLAGEFHRRDAEAVRAVESELCDLTGGEAAMLVPSFEIALTLALAATAGNREISVHSATDDGEIDWRWVAARAGAVLTIVPTPSPASESGGYGASGHAAVVRAPNADAFDLAMLAEGLRDECCLIDAAQIAGTLNPREFGYQSVDTIQERLAAGAHLVVVDGAGLLSGPPCGVLVGNRRTVDRIAQHPLAALAPIDPLTLAAWQTVLKVYRDDGTMPAIYQLPTWQLLTAPLANLQQRAARLSALIADRPSVGTVEALEVESAWRRSADRQWTAKSWVVELRPATGEAGAFAEQLAQGPYSILSKRMDGAIQFDLRTVFPRWDQQLVAAVRAAAAGS